MAVIANNTAPTSGAQTQPFVRTPGGNYDLVISNAAGATVYLGVGATVSSSNGCPIPNNGVLHLSGVAGGAAAALYVVLGGGAASGVVGYVLTTSV